MHNALIKQQDVAADEPQPNALPTPHFDETAIASAQPVEPISALSPHRGLLSWVQRPWASVTVVIIAALLSTSALALTVQLRRQSAVETAATQILTEQSPAQHESEIVADTQPEKPPPPRAKNSNIRLRPVREQTKPVARRVGVIVYSSSSDRP